MTAGVQSWAPRGFEVGWAQVPIPGGGRNRAVRRPHRRAALRLSDTSPAVEIDRSSLIGLRGAGLDATVDPTSGALTLAQRGTPLIEDGPRLALWRAPTDNDGLKLAEMQDLKPLGRWRTAGLDALEARNTVVKVAARGRDARVLVTREIVGSDPDAPVVQRETMTLRPDGAILATEDIRIPAHFDDLPRVGLRWRLPIELDALTWYGRGPVESYPDRHRGARLGRFSSTVLDQYVPYVMPQEHGGHADTRWAVVHTAAGRGLLVIADVPFQLNVSRYTPEQLTAATHAEELVPSDHVTLHVDVRHRGLGTLSCGPDTLPEYRIGPGRYRFAWAMQPVDVKRDDIAAIARVLRADCGR